MGEEMGKNGKERIEEREGGLMSALNKLEEYLKENGYEYERIDEPFMIEHPDGTEHDLGRHQIIVYEEGERSWDAVCQYGSYGFEDEKLEAN